MPAIPALPQNWPAGVTKISFPETAGILLPLFSHYSARQPCLFSGEDVHFLSFPLSDGPWPDSVLTSTLHGRRHKGFFRWNCNADWEELNYHNETLVFGNTEIIIWFFLCFFFFFNAWNDIIHPLLWGWGSSHWQAFPQLLFLCRLCPWAICGRHEATENRGLCSQIK